MKHLHDLPAWSKLWIHFDETKEQHMREMFEQDPQRAERYWLQVGGLTLDYSKKPHQRRNHGTVVRACP